MIAEPECLWCRIYKGERDMARSELAQSLTDAERLQIARLRAEIRHMQIAAERRNRELDALHMVWCDGGCETGVHRYDGRGPEAITQEIVDAAVRNTERLKRWWANRQYREQRKRA
jgi:hypothetical protein